MLDSDEIFDRSREAFAGNCIYFLMDGSEIVYVGQSINIYSRLGGHFTTDKKFDRFSWVCTSRPLNEAEADYIIKFNPKYNVGFPPCEKYTRNNSIKDLEIRAGIESRLTPLRPVNIDYEASSRKYNIYLTNDFLAAKAEVLRENLIKLDREIDQLKK